MRRTALAIFAHPDDIEYFGAGTLILLKQAGFETHYFNLSTGNCGSVEMSAEETRRVRLAEAQSAASILGAHFHHPICDDLEIFYDLPTLRLVAGVVRKVKPSIILTHPPHDYMEDHTNTCRLAVTAGFTHGVPNFVTTPLPMTSTRKTYLSITPFLTASATLSASPRLWNPLLIPVPSLQPSAKHLRPMPPNETGSTSLREPIPTSRSSMKSPLRLANYRGVSDRPRAGAATSILVSLLATRTH